jgi:MerR family transcriptional regulator, light-induced transcriptional regulator
MFESGNTEDTLLDSLTHSMIDFDEQRFEKTLNTAIMRLGFVQAFSKVIIPFMERTGLLWSTGIIKPVQEHFMSNLIIRKLYVAIDNQYVTKGPHSKRFILFLPEDEWHELMLLYTDLLLRIQNHEVIYLGCSVPLADILTFREYFRPDFLISYITAPMQPGILQQFIDKLADTYPDVKILLGGPQIAQQNPSLPPNVIPLSNVDSLSDAITPKP